MENEWEHDYHTALDKHATDAEETDAVHIRKGSDQCGQGQEQ